MPGKSNELHMKVLRHLSRYRLMELGVTLCKNGSVWWLASEMDTKVLA